MQTNLSVISQRYNAMKKQLITKIAAVMLQFTDDRFREQGWKDENLQPWQKRKNNKDVGRAILIKSGTMRRGNRIVSTTDHSVTIGNDVPYAKAHNDGFKGNVTVKAHTRKTTKGSVPIKSFVKNMNMPERKFMGESHSLRKKVRDLITDEVKSCFK